MGVFTICAAPRIGAAPFRRFVVVGVLAFYAISGGYALTCGIQHSYSNEAGHHPTDQDHHSTSSNDVSLCTHAQATTLAITTFAWGLSILFTTPDQPMLRPSRGPDSFSFPLARSPPFLPFG